MQSNDEITSIRKVLKNNDSITEDEYVNIINIFCKNTFGYNIELYTSILKIQDMIIIFQKSF